MPTTTSAPWYFYVIQRKGGRDCESFNSVQLNNGWDFLVHSGPYENWTKCMIAAGSNPPLV